MALLTDKQIQEIKDREQKAHEMVSALCKPRGTEGARSWLMSIPAQPDYDPDLVISASLRDNRTLLADREELLKYTQHLPSCGKWSPYFDEFDVVAAYRFNDATPCTCGLSPILEEIGKKETKGTNANS